MALLGPVPPLSLSKILRFFSVDSLLVLQGALLPPRQALPSLPPPRPSCRPPIPFPSAPLRSAIRNGSNMIYTTNAGSNTTTTDRQG